MEEVKGGVLVVDMVGMDEAEVEESAVAEEGRATGGMGEDVAVNVGGSRVELDGVEGMEGAYWATACLSGNLAVREDSAGSEGLVAAPGLERKSWPSPD